MHPKLLEKKLLEMVREDSGVEDITTEFTLNKRVKAEIIAKENGVVAGIYELSILFSLFNIKLLNSFSDGSKTRKNQRILILSGNSHDILIVERTALIILSRMSGISTLTTEILKEVKKINPKVRLAATRKTTPLFGYFEKRAVSLAGGDTHRTGLQDMVLIKDNHLKLFKNVGEAIRKAKENTSFAHKIEVEVSTPKEALEAARAGADIVMLDNFTPKRIGEAISLLEKNNLRETLLEASGGITKDNVAEYAKTGVDVVSLGMLTKSAEAKDFSLEII